MKKDAVDYITKQAKESGEYIGTLQFITKGIEKGYLDVDTIKEIIDERLDKWGRKLDS